MGPRAVSDPKGTVIGGPSPATGDGGTFTVNRSDACSLRVVVQCPSWSPERVLGWVFRPCPGGPVLGMDGDIGGGDDVETGGDDVETGFVAAVTQFGEPEVFRRAQYGRAERPLSPGLPMGGVTSVAEAGRRRAPGVSAAHDSRRRWDLAGRHDPLIRSSDLWQGRCPTLSMNPPFSRRS